MSKLFPRVFARLIAVLHLPLTVAGSVTLPVLPLAACSDDSAATTANDSSASDTASDVTATTSDAQHDATGETSTGDSAKQKLIFSVPQTETWALQGLSAPVQVVRSEGDIAHIYAKNRKDLAHVMGFVMGRHRYFQMELTRRLGLGEISALLGDAALAQDMQARMAGSAAVAQSTLDRLTPEEQQVFDGFAAGINDYIAQVVAGKLPPPSEIQLAAGLLGGTAKTLMQPWDRRSVAGASAAIIYNLGYETDDVGRTAKLAKLAGHFDGKALADLRKAGALADIFYNAAPIHAVSSAAGLGLDYKGKAIAQTEPGKLPAGKAPSGQQGHDKAWLATILKKIPKSLPKELADRHDEADRRWQRRSGHDRTDGFGSNAWAVAGAVAKDGAALLAGDGHLPLTVPSLFYQLGLDTRVFGGGPTHQKGLVIPGLPVMAVGTNGQVAWSQTQLVGDITDWYRDQVVLDDKGMPIATQFKENGKIVNKPLQAVQETYVIADVPALGSKGRTETWTRWITWDGRWVTDIEGPEAKPGSGGAVIAVNGKFITPKDTDGDGIVTAIAFDFTGLDKPAILNAVDGFGHSDSVWQLRDHTRKLVAYSQNIVAADNQGNVLYTGYQAVPCRKHLPRDDKGEWLAGADPKQLIDGTQYTGFTIPTLADGRVDESQAADPTRCVVPFDEYPQSVNPPQGFVLTGNNDPGNLSTDGNLRNDKWYIGGPWANGYRADSIATGLQQATADQQADAQRMAGVQALQHSRMGLEWVPFLQAAIDKAKQLSNVDKVLSADEQRLVDLYTALTPTVRDDALARLDAWHKAGAPAASGVETFYHALQQGETAHAIATSLFNAWMSRLMALTLDDEGIDLYEPWGGDGRSRAMSFLRNGRGASNPLKQASWNAATGESAFWDRLDTPATMERSEEVALLALQQAIAQLAGPQGFGSTDPAKWLWGMRHGVHFDSILASFFGADEKYAALTAVFSITPARIPLLDKLPPGDPRADLTQFPRPGDAFAVDAAGGVFSNGYGSGPVFRMVIALGKDKTTGLNVIPGGQSGLTDSPHFDDQVRSWLGNQAWPLRFEVEDVVAGAKGREVYTPAP